MVHLQCDRTKKVVTILQHCPCGVGSTEWKIPFVQLWRGEAGNTDPDVHITQCLVCPGFTDYKKNSSWE